MENPIFYDELGDTVTLPTEGHATVHQIVCYQGNANSLTYAPEPGDATYFVEGESTNSRTIPPQLLRCSASGLNTPVAWHALSGALVVRMPVLKEITTYPLRFPDGPFAAGCGLNSPRMLQSK
jgi:hypothetical protein